MADETTTHVHVLRVRDHRIRCADPVMVAGGFGHDAVALDLDADWAGLSCVVTLGEGDGAWTAAVGADPVEVPASAIAEPGWLPVSVTGYGDDGAVRATTEACAHLLRVAESGYVPSDADVPDAPDLLGQLLAAGQKATDAADAANDAAKAAKDAVARVDEALSDIGDAAANATAARESAEAAAKSASGAKASESSARASAEAAASDASAASSSAAAAQQSATNAASSASAAGQSATKAKSSADSASLSASSASDDARTASQSASTAASAASSASDAASGAQSSASAAQTAATSAQEGASTAQTAAETATTQAQAASASATAAAQSATDAKASADLAAGWVPADGEPGQLLSKTDSGTAWVDPPSGNVLVGNATGNVAHAEDAYAQKPIEVRVKGRTVKNLWPVINRSSNGITVSTDETGLITVSGTSTAPIRSVITVVVPAQAGKAYSVIKSSANSGMSSLNYEMAIDASRSDSGNDFIASMYSPGGGTSKTFTTPDDTAGLACIIRVDAGLTINASFRVMLVEGDTAPDCFTPTGLHSVEPKKMVTAGKNLLDSSTFDETSSHQGILNFSLPAGTYTLSCYNAEDWWTDASNSSRWFIHDADSNPITETNMGSPSVGSRSHATFTLPTSGDFTLYTYIVGVSDMATDLQLELGSTATAYEPPNVTKVALPETDPLMYVFDRGDELVIGADGTCRAERQVYHEFYDGSQTNPGPVEMEGYQYVALNSTKNKPTGTTINRAAVISDRFASGNMAPGNVVLTSGPVSGDGSLIAFLFCFEPGTFADAAEVRQWFTDNPTNVWFAGMPETEQLGTVTLPQLPAPTFNQYHDADVPSDTSVEYERDINIALEQLESKIAFLNVAQATS